MRSLHVITSDARRGAETFAVELSRTLVARGHAAEVVALASSGLPRPHDVPVLGPSRRAPGTLLELRRRAHDADVVVAHGSSTLEACVTALTGRRTPIVYRSIGDPAYWVSTAAKRRYVGALLRRTTCVAALWREAADVLVGRYGLDARRVAVVANAVPAERFPPRTGEEQAAARAAFGVDPDVPCLAVVGALSAEKEVRTAVSAVAAVAGAVLLVAGDGPDRSGLEQEARRSAPGRVRFLGVVQDPRPVYAAADLLLLPSRSEGMPGVLIEAGFTGVPTVASRVGGVPEMIVDGETGFLADAGDGASLARCVTAALPSAADVGGRAAVSFRRRFSMERAGQDWDALLHAVAGDRLAGAVG